jgi:steroid 5-alpha reductase family enzyme
MEALVFWIALLGIVAIYMTAWYALALSTKRYDVVDSAWALGFILVAWVSLALRSNFGSLQVISALIVSVWGVRLFGHLAQRNWHRSTDDARYATLRTRWGTAANRKAYTNIFLLQGLLIVAISTPMITIAFSRTQPNAVSYAGWAIWLLGIAFETIADRQLADFIRNRKANSHAILDKGLWRYSRHPNYFGEIVAWLGAAVVACGAREWWGMIGPVVITLLILKVSGIPLLERRHAHDKHYQAYQRKTSIFFPLPPRKTS